MPNANVSIKQVRDLILNNAADVVNEIENAKIYHPEINFNDNIDVRKQLSSAINLMASYGRLHNGEEYLSDRFRGIEPIEDDQFYAFDIDVAIDAIKQTLESNPHDKQARNVVLMDLDKFAKDSSAIIKENIQQIRKETGFIMPIPKVGILDKNNFNDKMYRNIAFAEAYSKSVLKENGLDEIGSNYLFSANLISRLIDDAAKEYTTIREYEGIDNRDTLKYVISDVLTNDDNISDWTKNAIENTRAYDYLFERKTLINELHEYAYCNPLIGSYADLEPIPGYEKIFAEAHALNNHDIGKWPFSSLTRGGRLTDPKDIATEIENCYAIGGEYLQPKTAHDMSFIDNIPTVQERESAIREKAQTYYNYIEDKEIKQAYVDAAVLQYTGNNIYKEYRAMIDSIIVNDCFDEDYEMSEDEQAEFEKWQNLSEASDGDYNFQYNGVPSFEVFVAHHDEIISKMPPEVAHDLIQNPVSKDSIMNSHELGHLVKDRKEAVNLLVDLISNTQIIYTRDGATTPTRAQAMDWIESSKGIIADIYHAAGFGDDKSNVDVYPMKKDDLWRAAMWPDTYKDVTDAMLLKATEYLNKDSGRYEIGNSSTIEKLKSIKTELLDKYRDENGVIDSENLKALVADHPAVYAIETGSVQMYQEYVYHKDNYDHDITMNQFIDNYDHCIAKEYATEHDHVTGKQIDTQNLTLSSLGMPAAYCGSSLSDNIEDLAENLSRTYEIHNDRGTKVGCEPTPEGVMTYMNAVQSLYARGAGDISPEQFDDIMARINDDMRFVQEAADIESAKQALAQDGSDQEQNIEKDIQTKKDIDHEDRYAESSR